MAGLGTQATDILGRVAHFMNSLGQAVSVQLDASGNVPVNIQAGTSIPIPIGAATDASLLLPLGSTPYHYISLASLNPTSIKGSAGRVYSIVASNTNAAIRYLKLYDKASAPVVGTDTPVHTYLLPGAAVGSTVVIPVSGGQSYLLGIAFAMTVGMADTDTVAVGAADIVVNVDYK